MTETRIFISFRGQPTIEFGKILICVDCKNPLPNEKDRYQHQNVWPLCQQCSELREEKKVMLMRRSMWGKHHA